MIKNKTGFVSKVYILFFLLGSSILLIVGSFVYDFTSPMSKKLFMSNAKAVQEAYYIYCMNNEVDGGCTIGSSRTIDDSNDELFDYLSKSDFDFGIIKVYNLDGKILVNLSNDQFMTYNGKYYKDKHYIDPASEDMIDGNRPNVMEIDNMITSKIVNGKMVNSRYSINDFKYNDFKSLDVNLNDVEEVHFVSRLNRKFGRPNKLRSNSNIYFNYDKLFRALYISAEKEDVLISINNEGLFKNMHNLVKVDLGNAYLTKIASKDMFSGCDKLVKVKFSKNTFDKDTYYILEGMFKNCKSIVDVDFSNTNLVKITTSVDNLFYNCKSLEDIKFREDINYENISDSKGVFYNCESLDELRRIR